MFRDYGEPGPSSGAGGAYGGPAQPPATGQQVRGTRRLGSPGGQSLGLCGPLPHTRGLGPGTRSREWVSEQWQRIMPILRCLRALSPPLPSGTGAAGGANICEHPLSRSYPFPSLSAVYLSLRLRYLLSFFLFTANFFVPSTSEGDPLVRD